MDGPNDWQSRMDALWLQLDVRSPAAFVAAIDALAAERSEGDAAALFERAAARDSTGVEDAAEPLYRAALATGRLDPYRRTRATIQLASTLRILGRLDESESLLLAERDREVAGSALPLRDELRAILAMTWIAQGRSTEAAALALLTLSPHLSRYNRSTARNARDILERVRTPTSVPTHPGRTGHGMLVDTTTEEPVMPKNTVAQLLTVSLALSSVAPAFAQTAAAPKRFPQLTMETLPPDARPLGEEIIKISSIGLAGPYNVMLRSPVMADRMKRLLDYLRFNNSLPPRLSEFAILIQGRLWTSNVEWYAHHPLAIKAGLPESVAADLKANVRPRDMKPDEAIVYDVCMQMSTKQHISDELFAQAKATLGEQQLVDLVALSGTYVSVAMLLNLGEENSPADKPIPFPETVGVRR